MEEIRVIDEIDELIMYYHSIHNKFPSHVKMGISTYMLLVDQEFSRFKGNQDDIMIRGLVVIVTPDDSEDYAYLEIGGSELV